MSCGCKPVRARAYRDLGGPPVAAGHVEVTGTWDFKWPVGTEIRVAFQAPSDSKTREDLPKLRARIIALASRWPIRVAAPGRRDTEAKISGISLIFLDPESDLDEPLGEDGVLGAEHSSPFLPGDRDFLQYDVLISLEDLPLVRIDPFQYRGDPNKPADKPSGPRDEGRERVILPLSETGSYCRRVDYGAPTMYLGRFGSAKEKLSVLEHLESELGQHVVVHEFGHVLGLVHEHQNPKYKERKYLPPREVARKVKQRFGLDVNPTEDEVKAQVIDAWPGGVDFSDWGDPKEPLSQLDSVMTYPYHRELLEPAPALAEQPEHTEIVTRPSETDIENLRRMYDRRPARRVRVGAAG